MSFAPVYKYVSDAEVVDLIRARNAAGKDAEPEFVLVDVRDDDFEGGNVPGAKNVPSHKFQEEVDELVKSSANVPKVIFSCALSQSRAPKAARIYSEARSEKPPADGTKEQEILVLRGGFVEWQAKYRNDPALVEKYDKEAWDARYY